MTTAVLLGVLLGFTLGVMITRYLTNFKWLSQDWQYLKWNDDVLAYRRFTGKRIMKNERVIIGFAVDTSGLPGEGYKINRL